MIVRRLLLIISMTLASTASGADLPFSISLDPMNSASVEAHGIQPVDREGIGRIEAEVSGIEASECKPYGRKSSAYASADTQILRQETHSLSLLLTSSANAYGGHYRICTTCVLNNCVGILPIDTRAQAKANAQARIVIEFNKDFLLSYYLLGVAISSQNTAPQVKLVDARHNTQLSLENQPIKLKAEAGAIYYLELALPVSTSNEGGCCNDRKSASAHIDIRLTKAPILTSVSTYAPFIGGGEPTNSYANVGAILINGQLHCTG